MNAGVEHREQRVEDGGRHAGAADRHPAGAREQHGAHDIRREARPHTDCASLHGALLVGGKIAGAIGLPVLAPSAELTP